MRIEMDRWADLTVEGISVDRHVFFIGFCMG